MFRQDRTNPSTAVSNWRGRHESSKGWPSTAVSTWLNGGLFGVAVPFSAYFAGGLSGSTYGDWITRVDFPTDTFSILTATIGTGGRSLGSLSNNNTAGYMFGGGEETGVSSQSDEINKMLFDSETSSVLGVAMGTAMEGMGSLANSPTSGYLSGGSVLGVGAVSTVRVFTFSSDSYASDASALSAANNSQASFSNNGTAGYWAGGGSGIDTIDKTTFSDGSLATLSATLGAAVRNVGGTSNSGTAGYAYGGYHLGWDNLNKLTYSTDANAVISLSTALERYSITGASNSGTAAYWYGGVNSSHSKVNSILKTPYATDVTAALSATITIGATTNSSGFANCESL
jgi:hypothetical protein